LSGGLKLNGHGLGFIADLLKLLTKIGAGWNR